MLHPVYYKEVQCTNQLPTNVDMKVLDRILGSQKGQLMNSIAIASTFTSKFSKKQVIYIYIYVH